MPKLFGASQSGHHLMSLNMLSFKFPVTAIVSILHRISGVVLVLMLPIALWMLDESLASPARFAALGRHWQSGFLALLIDTGLIAALYHTLAGLRHLVMDLGVGETRQGGRCTAYVLLWLTLLGVAFILGGLLW